MAAKAVGIVWRDRKNMADSSNPPVKGAAGSLGIVKINCISETVIAVMNTVLVVLHVS